LRREITPELKSARTQERGRSGYIDVVRGLLDKLPIRAGEQVVEVGCGSGVIMRELARRTAGANCLIGVDQNLYSMREARALAGREGLPDRIDLREGSAEALPLPDGFTDVALCPPRKATPSGCLASWSASPNPAGASASRLQHRRDAEPACHLRVSDQGRG
jgi:SAM-dependent methyltransferase